MIGRHEPIMDQKGLIDFVTKAKLTEKEISDIESFCNRRGDYSFWMNETNDGAFELRLKDDVAKEYLLIRLKK